MRMTQGYRRGIEDGNGTTTGMGMGMTKRWGQQNDGNDGKVGVAKQQRRSNDRQNNRDKEEEGMAR